MAKCTPCIGKQLRRILLDDRGSGVEVEEALSKIPDCPGPQDIRFCGGGKGKRGGGKREPSEYNIFIGKCMRAKNIKGFGNAAPAMRECARAWKERG